MDLLQSLLPNADPNRDADEGPNPPQCPAEEVAAQIKTNLANKQQQGQSKEKGLRLNPWNSELPWNARPITRQQEETGSKGSSCAI